jgi:predicted nucleic acid-binding protein
MFHKTKIYLDTSVINFLFADDAPEKKEITVDLFENFIQKEKYITYVSDVVIAEIQSTKKLNKRKKLLNVIKTFPIEIITLNEEERKEVEIMAYQYIHNKIIPPNKVADAFHIAITLVKQLDYLVSWNYKHLANVNREMKIKIVNFANNYLHEFRIITPIELIYYEN